ncbi:MAG TPA: universal stress protein [Solirubrobacteraceae bacterium]|jgi:nucleotide-binding universal stress UspA family protein
MFRSIVVGTDGSETASEAVRQAAQLAAALGARVHLVCVYEPVPSSQAAGDGDVHAESGWMLRPREAVDATLDDAAAVFAAAGVEVERYAQRGDPADAILDVAEERGADLIIVGNRGQTGAKRFLLGSVPNRISHHAPCAVLIIRTA